MRYTENLLLKKPDLADSPPDITVFNENWDKIDEKLKKLPVQNGGLYINDETTEEDKAEAKEALKSFGMFPCHYHLETTDLLDISLKLGLHSSAVWKNYPENDMDSRGIALILDYATTTSDSWRMIIYYSANNPDRIAYNTCISDNQGNLNWSGWCKLGRNGDFLPLDGSVPMSGQVLYINQGLGRWLLNNDSLMQLEAFTNKNDTNNRTMIAMSAKTDIKDALSLIRYIDGKPSPYKLFGEHNTELLATQIQSLIDSGVIEVGGFKSPIKIQRGSTGTTAVTGTGKGKLFFNADYHSDLTLVVDGLTLVSNKENPSVYHNAEVEFTKSFSIKSSTDNYPIGYTAVFY